MQKPSEKYDAQRSYWTDMLAAPSATRIFVPHIPVALFSDGRCHRTGSSHEKAYYSMSKSWLPEISKLVSVHAVKAYEEEKVQLQSFCDSV